MITQQTYALLALRVYDAEKVFNKPMLPTGWTELPNPIPVTSGFAYAVYQGPGSDIVISYRGTDDLLSADMLTNLGLNLSQERQAAEVYASVLRDHPSSNITFTGHSLGGGLAATMAVWFNQPAVVFDPAPSELVARDFLGVSYVIAALNAPVPQSILDYRSSISTQFATRESNVSSYFAPGSIVYAGNTAFNTITGAGQSNPVQFGIANMGSVDGRVNMHSQALLTAGLLSAAFPAATVTVQTALPVIMDKQLYNLPTSGSQPNFLIDLIRSEQTTPGDSKLDNFSEDLSKLGTNIAGLNAAAQKALIAQGIEWYYWQGTDYAGQNFFINNPTTPGLLQYNSAVGAGLQNAQDKATLYVDKWLTPLYNANGAFGGRNSFDQWSVVADNTGVTVTARDNTKSQIFIGQDGADNFTGGVFADVLMGGAGNDTLDGGNGYDLLYGGAGNDEYNFSGAFGADVIQDSDSAGLIKVDGTTLDGGKKVDDNVWESADGIYRYQLFSHGATNDLVIGQGSKAGCRSQCSRNDKNHSKPMPFCMSQRSFYFAKILGQSQHTRNGYFRKRLSTGNRPVFDSARAEAARC